jgi:hypothetical protein
MSASGGLVGFTGPWLVSLACVASLFELATSAAAGTANAASNAASRNLGLVI